MSENVEYFFENEVGYINSKELYNKYFECIKIAGISTPLSSLKKNLGGILISKFGEEALDLLNSNPLKNDWLSYLSIERIKHIHPIRHVLLMVALSNSVQEFLTNEFGYKPFGNGPWACMNILSDHYTMETIKDINLVFNKYKGEFQGEFKCNCGFTYILNIGENSPLNIENFHFRIKEKGDVWNREFSKLVSRGVPISEIATITKQAKGTVRKIIKFGHDSFEQEKARKRKLIIKNEDIQKNINRREWIKLRRKFPNLLRTELIAANKSLYTKLRSKDAVWLDENLPLSKRGRSKLSKEAYFEKDLAYLEKAKYVINKWSEYEKQADKLIKITKIPILVRIGLDSRYVNKYKMTFSFIKSVLESHGDYQIRIIKNCIATHFDDTELKRYKILSLSGLRKLEPQAKKYLDDIIKEHNTPK
ncbi:TnsD family Tn7-like transposition protein [Lysinibacillus sp. NPDC097231]|uniref:TnsD family Tn7-like transposition protein n=1 Tax=Lysinibacillus sp. NPDC097231 TaxID=3364142 RepID=UPI0037F83ACE